MGSSRSSGPTCGALVPWTIHDTATLAATNLYILPIPDGTRYRVGRITSGSGTVATDTFVVSVGNESSATQFLTAGVLAVGASNIIDSASADTSEKIATGGTSYILITLTRSTTGTVVNPTVTVWLWMTAPPEALARRSHPGSLNQT